MSLPQLNNNIYSYIYPLPSNALSVRDPSAARVKLMLT